LLFYAQKQKKRGDFAGDISTVGEVQISPGPRARKPEEAESMLAAVLLWGS